MSRTRLKLKGLSLDRLETLSNIVESGGIMRAAGGDPNRQSQFSRQVAELEAWFGVQLLDRSSSPCVPTEAALRIVKQVNDFRNEMDAVRESVSTGPPLAIFGAGERMIRSYLIPWASRNIHLEAKLVFRNLTSSAVRAELLAKRLDFGIMRAEDVPKGMVVIPLKPISMQLVVPASIANNKRKASWADLENLPMVKLEGGGSFNVFLQEAAAEAGRSLNVAMECSTWSQMMDAMTACGLAGFLPKDLADRLPAGQMSIYAFAPLSGYCDRYVIAWSASNVEKNPKLQGLAKALGSSKPLKSAASSVLLTSTPSGS